jgi:HEXXH motif-containing protein
MGHPGSWEVSFDRPISLRWGAFISPALRELKVSGCGVGSKLRQRTAEGAESEFDLDSGDCDQPPPGWQNLDKLCIVDRHFVILAAKTQPLFPPTMFDVSYSNESPDAIASALRYAISIVREYAENYATWIEDVLWGLIPVRPPTERGYYSGSVTGLHGIIYQSFPLAPLYTAEGLIHEASHQYYHAAQSETLFSNGQDTRLYWSPYPKRDRPVERILLAFHAFANVILFYRACMAAAGSSRQIEHATAEISFHLSNLRAFSRILENSPGLTADGRDLFEALHAKLFG